MTTSASIVHFTVAGNLDIADDNFDLLWESNTRCDDDCYLAIDVSGLLAIFSAATHRIIHSFYVFGQPLS